MEFTDFPPCRHRFGCLQCRNDKKFVEHMKERFGDWECPEGIPFGTPLEKMPKHIQKKHEAYTKRLKEQGREIPENRAQSNEEQKNTLSLKAQGFTDLPMCKKHLVCVQCRNDEKFRNRMSKSFGKWECPENIPFNTPLEEMPEYVRKDCRKFQLQSETNKKKRDNIKQSFDELEAVVPPQALGLLDSIRAYIFHDEKREKLCKFNTGETKMINKKCCGGKTKQVEGLVCEKFGDVTKNRCLHCSHFKSKRGK